jgi:nucleoside-diphosphate kinase
MKKIHMTRTQAEGFYAVHSERPFFGELCDFMSSGPCVVMVLEGENAILRNREIMGATNPAEAAEGTLRQLYADSIGNNAVHGSDAPETAAVEINYFFNAFELH